MSSLLERIPIPPSAFQIPAPSPSSPDPNIQSASGRSPGPSTNPSFTSRRSRLASFPPPQYASDRDHGFGKEKDGQKEKDKEKDHPALTLGGMNLTNLAPSTLTANLSNSVSDMFLSSLLPSSLPRSSSAANPLSSTASAVAARFYPLTSQKEPLSLPLMTNNFRRFVARCGFVFWSMDRVEEVIYWRRKERTALFIVLWGIVSFHPRLILLVPSTILIILLLNAYVASHPSLAISSILSGDEDEDDGGRISIVVPKVENIPTSGSVPDPIQSNIYASGSAGDPSARRRISSPPPSGPLGLTVHSNSTTSTTSTSPSPLNPGSGSIKAGLLASQLARDVMGKVTQVYDSNHLGLGIGLGVGGAAAGGVGASPRKGSAIGIGQSESFAGSISQPINQDRQQQLGDVISATAAEMKKQDASAAATAALDRSRSRDRWADPAAGANDPSSDGAGASIGPAESGVDYYVNLQGIQNLMGVVSDVHDAITPYATFLSPPIHPKSGPPPPITFPLSTTHILLLFLPPTIILPLLPASALPFILLTIGWAPLVVFHPSLTMQNLRPVIAFVNQLAIETSDWYNGTSGSALPMTNASGTPYGLKRLYAKAERWALTDRLEDVIARAEIQEVYVWENERLDGSWVANNVKPGEGKTNQSSADVDSPSPGENSWSEKHLRGSERRGWVKALPMKRPEDSLWEDNPTVEDDTAGGNGDGSGRGRDAARDGGGGGGQKVSLSLVKGWAFVPGEDWRVDVVGDWNGLRADENGWVYFNDSWEDPSMQAVTVTRVGDEVKKQVRVTRRRRWWRRVYSESTVS